MIGTATKSVIMEMLAVQSQRRRDHNFGGVSGLTYETKKAAIFKGQESAAKVLINAQEQKQGRLRAALPRLRLLSFIPTSRGACNCRDACCDQSRGRPPTGTRSRQTYMLQNRLFQHTSQFPL